MLSRVRAVVPQRSTLLPGVVGALIVAIALFFSNPHFSLLEDETSIIDAAGAPLNRTIELFTTGAGQHEHPPLSDILLHFWLPVAGVNPSLVRLPSILFYAIALLSFALAAQKLDGPTAFYATMLFGMVWPFGFHFGRLAGWYSFSLLLVGLLTLAYLYFLEKPSWARWLLVVSLSFAAIVSNYFCWAVVALIGLDMALTIRDRQAFRYLTAGLAILCLGFGPLWVTFTSEVRDNISLDAGHGIGGTILDGGFNLYALFISESVAPWFWIASIPAGIAAVTALVCTLQLTHGRSRRVYLGFCLLFSVMAVVGIIGTKRLLFISGWLLTAIGCALANRERPHLRALLAGSLLVTTAVGWAGILARKYYAAPHFIEPWATIAQTAAQQVGRGATVISNSPSFLFYLNTALHDSGLQSNDTPGWAKGPGVISLLQSDLPEPMPGRETLFVRGVNTSATERTSEAEEWLLSHCRLESTSRMIYDTGFELKKRFFPLEIDDPYRVRIQQFDCSSLEPVQPSEHGSRRR